MNSVSPIRNPFMVAKNGSGNGGSSYLPVPGVGLLPTPPIECSIMGSVISSMATGSSPWNGGISPRFFANGAAISPTSCASSPALANGGEDLVKGVTCDQTQLVEQGDRKFVLRPTITIANDKCTSRIQSEYKNSFIDFADLSNSPGNVSNYSLNTTIGEAAFRNHSCSSDNMSIEDSGGHHREMIIARTKSCPQQMTLGMSDVPGDDDYDFGSKSSLRGTTPMGAEYPPPAFGTITTYMIRNIPTRFTSISFVRLLEEHGFGKTFDFFYLPMDFRSGKNMGYAFINFVNQEIGEKFVNVFNQRRLPVSTSKKVIEIAPSRRQGLHENVALFRTSDLLSSVSLPHYKPLIATSDGSLVPLSDMNFI